MTARPLFVISHGLKSRCIVIQLTFIDIVVLLDDDFSFPMNDGVFFEILLQKVLSFFRKTRWIKLSG